MPKYTIFNPPAPSSPGSMGSRNSTVLKKMFPNTLKVFGGESGVLEGVKEGTQVGLGSGTNDIYEYAKVVFTPDNVKGDNEMWIYSNPDLYGQTPNGFVSRTYSAAPNTSTIVTDKAGKLVGPYIPNISSAPNADPSQQPDPPSPSPDYNSIVTVDKTKYVSNHGVFAPSESSKKTRITLGQSLTYGKSKNSTV